ncbi:MAG: hypothetical protein K5697_00725 [Lachnospiraceae bacterium]|nr:hypothetical protein [Lachnospiraceae bacterium]
MSFHYHDEVVMRQTEGLLNELADNCRGRNLSVSAFVEDECGMPDSDALLGLLLSIVRADIPESEWVYAGSKDPEGSKEREKYLVTLLFVAVMAARAGLNRIVGSGGTRAVNDDSFSELLYQFTAGTQGMHLLSNRKGQKEHICSPSLKQTAETLYLMLTGKRIPFPDPYHMKTDVTEQEEETPAQEPSGEQEEEASVQEPFEEQEEIWDDEDSCEYEPDSEFFETYEEPEDYDEDIDLYFSMKQQEEEEYYRDDPQSREDYEKLIDAEDPRDATAHYGDLSKPVNRECFERDACRIRLAFPDPSAYVEMYESLVGMTKAEYAGLETGLENKIDAWLRDSGKTLYTDEKALERISEAISLVISEVRRCQIRRGLG